MGNESNRKSSSWRLGPMGRQWPWVIWPRRFRQFAFSVISVPFYFNFKFIPVDGWGCALLTGPGGLITCGDFAEYIQSITPVYLVSGTFVVNLSYHIVITSS